MRFLSYAAGTEASFGVLTETGVRDLRSLPDAVTLRDAIAGYGGELGSVVADHLASHPSPTVAMTDLDLLPPITDPSKIICAGVNYKSHRDEVGLGDPPEYPPLFSRFNDSHVAAGHPVTRPSSTHQLDWEGEVAVVIGRRIDGVSNDAEAMAAIAGFSLYNDLSVRDWQMRTSQWLPGKNFAGVGAFGPVLVTPDEIDDLSAVRLTAAVNGEIVQDAVIDDLIFDVPSLIRYISAFTPLAPGDVIVTDTPGGVGFAMDPPRFLSPGDVVVVAATGLGECRTEIV